MKRGLIAAATIATCVVAGAQQTPPPFDWSKLIAPLPEGTLVGYYTGEKLYRQGRDSPASMGYVVAVYDASWSGSKDFCVPDGVTSGQLRDVTWKYLEQNPESRHYSAAYLVKRSFAVAWPCQRN